MAEIRLIDLTKVYGDGTKAVSSLNIDIADGEFLVLVGPSGCGKTSALRMVAGLEEVTAGVIEFGGHTVNKLPPKDRDVAMVFQNYSLYPVMSVFDNMAFGLRRRGLPKGEVRKRVCEAASILNITDLLGKKPGILSGGERQRVAMGRAIVREPQVFLMDEPLSNLDAKLRVQMRAEIARIQRNLGTTTIYVTHDQSEAMTLGDRVVVMRAGFLQQIDTPETLYDRPTNLFVAGFIGSPAMNLFEADVLSADGRTDIRLAGQTITLSADAAAERAALRRYVGRRVAVGIRPEEIGSVDPSEADARIPVIVDFREHTGADVFLYFKLDVPIVQTDDVREAGAEDADGDAASGPAAGRLVARVTRERAVAEGARIELGFQTRKLHFFDLESGAAIYRD